MTMEARIGSLEIGSLLAPWRRRKALVAAIFVVTLAAGGGVALFLPDLYQATATILIERPQIIETLVRGGGTGDLEARLQTIREQVSSRARLWSVITARNLYPDLRAQQPAEVVVNRMRRDLNVTMKGVEDQHAHDSGSTITLAVSFRGRDPKTVAAVANALATEYVQENSTTRERRARGTSEFLKTQLDQARAQLDTQEARINTFRQRFGSELPSGQAAALSALERMGLELSRNAASQERIKDRLAALDRESGTRVIPPLPDGTQSDEARVVSLQAQLAELRQRFTEEYPDVAVVKAELAAVQRRLQQPGRSGAGVSGGPGRTTSAGRSDAERTRLENDLKALRDDQRRLQPNIASYESRLARMSGRDLELEQLSRDYLSTREQYDMLLKRHSEATLAERVELQSQGEKFSILDAALPPTQPTAPNRQRLLAMAFVFAAGVTLALVLLIHRLDGSLHTIDEVRAMTTVLVLATVPPIVTSRDRVRGLWRAGLTAVALALAVALAVGGASVIASGNEDLVRMFSRGAS